MHWFPKSSSKSRLLLAAQENGPIRSAFVVVLDRVLPAECSDGGVGVPWRLGSSEQRRPARSPPAGDEEQCQGHRERGERDEPVLRVAGLGRSPDTAGGGDVFTGGRVSGVGRLRWGERHGYFAGRFTLSRDNPCTCPRGWKTE
jgi:hypothetical protein